MSTGKRKLIVCPECGMSTGNLGVHKRHRHKIATHNGREVEISENARKPLVLAHDKDTGWAPDAIGIMLHSVSLTATDRADLDVRFRAHLQQQVSVARITADVENDKKTEKLRRIVNDLSNELRSAHARWADDLICAHSIDETATSESPF